MSVIAVSRSEIRSLSKVSRSEIQLILHRGVRDDYHCLKEPYLSADHLPPHNQRYLRQVLLLESETLQSLLEPDSEGRSWLICPGQFGENITTFGINLGDMREGTRLRLGTQAILRVTGMRFPHKQFEGLAEGLVERCVRRNYNGELVGMDLGVFAVVVREGCVKPGDSIQVEHVSGSPRLQWFMGRDGAEVEDAVGRLSRLLRGTCLGFE